MVAALAAGRFGRKITYAVLCLGSIGGALLLFTCLIWILFAPPGILPPYLVGLLAGTASGAAMIPYTVIKEANPPELGGSATGVINFINFTFSALLGPLIGWMLVQVSEGKEGMELEQYQAGFRPLLYGLVLALVLTCFLKETGPAIRGEASNCAELEQANSPSPS